MAARSSHTYVAASSTNRDATLHHDSGGGHCSAASFACMERCISCYPILCSFCFSIIHFKLFRHSVQLENVDEPWWWFVMLMRCFILMQNSADTVNSVVEQRGLLMLPTHAFMCLFFFVVVMFT